MRPIIGVTVGEAVNKDYPLTPKIQGQQFTYVDALVRAGATPVLLPIVYDTPALQRLYELCDGLLFAGGNDIDPALYGAEHSVHTRNIFVARDEQELRLLKWALDDDKPVLGICRGMQLINVLLGGTLYQDIATDLPYADVHMDLTDATKDPYYKIVHQLEIEPDSRLATILGATNLGTNAYHHQAIQDVGSGLKVVAKADDGVIEAIELPEKHFVIGVQSHPEALESEAEPRWQKLFSTFVESTRV